MAQIIDIKWQMTYGGNGDDRGTAIIQSADSGFVVAGYSNALDGRNLMVVHLLIFVMQYVMA